MDEILCEPCPFADNNEAGNKQEKPSKQPTTGKVSLIKVQFDTMSKVFADKPDKKGESILYVINDGGEDVHWSKNNELYKKNNFANEIPVAVNSYEKFKISAWFEVTESLSAEPGIAITIPDLPEYTFESDILQGAKEKGIFKLTFEISNTPYTDRIKYIPCIEVEFHYSVENTWLLAGMSKNKLYMTWREPQFYDSKPESLYYLACKQGYKSRANSKQLSEEQWMNSELKNIADSVFDNFTSLNTRRVNETFLKGMGYWRGVSALDSKVEMIESSTSLIEYGEGTCGDWVGLFEILIKMHGFSTDIKFNIATPASFFKEKEVEEVKLASLVKKKLVRTPDGSKFIKKPFNDDIKVNFLNYYEFVPSLLLIKDWDLGTIPSENSNEHSDSHPVQKIPTMAQGNDKPLSMFRDHTFIVIKTEEGAYWYDPSYGKKSTKAFVDSRELVNDFTESNLSGILIAATCPKNSGKGSQLPENSIGKYIEPISYRTDLKSHVHPYIYRGMPKIYG